jgi:Tfp pilus assembly protein PilX
MRVASLSKQTGAGLIVALIMLIVMSMAAIAMVRSVESGLLATGNFAFRQSAILGSDAGSEAAIKWLTPLANMTDLFADNASQGYYASLPTGLDITDSGLPNTTVLIDWDNNECNGRENFICVKPAAELEVISAGNRIRYVIHRLCKKQGSPLDAANGCLQFQGAGSTNKSAISYGQAKHFQLNPGVYYRITTRAKGPRNTIVFTQTMVHF